MDRKSHLFCIECSKDVSEVSGRNNNIDLISCLDGTFLDQFRISIYIIYDLRYQTADVDGVCGGELEASLVKLCGKFLIVEHLLDCGLCVVEVSCDTYNGCVGTLLSYHLLLLDRAYTVLRIEYDNPCSRNICKTSQCSLTGISGSCSQDHDVVLDLVLSRCCCHKMWKNGQCHILESDGRTVEQFQIVSSICLMKRCDLCGVEFLIVCICNTVLQLFFCKICKKTAHNFIGCFLICHLSKFLYRNIQFRNRSRYEQTSVFGKSFQNSHRRCYCLAFASGALI